MLSKKKIQELAKENEDLLEALQEFDRTGQLRKLSYKERATFTIDETLMAKLRAYCKKRGIKMSSLVEKLIKVELDIIESKEKIDYHQPSKKIKEEINRELWGIG